MIKVPATTLSPTLEAALAGYQADIDAQDGYPAQVSKATELFSASNTKQNQVFQEIKTALDQMCTGARRCMYCEDSAADEVEHFKPKQFYPDQTFVWNNYLYACGQCNVSKSAKFALRLSSGAVHHLIRQKKAVPVAPPIGTDLLINPRFEDPLLFLQMDIVDTFYILPRAHLLPADQERAEYTIQVLALNRDLLLRARKESYGNYFARITEIAAHKAQGVAIEKLVEAAMVLGMLQHNSVWIEMRRRRSNIASLAAVFSTLPELAPTLDLVEPHAAHDGP